MIKNFYQTRSLGRQLDKLRRADKKGAMAASRAEQIINKLLLYAGAEKEDLRSKRTKSGELRLKNCRKYDLGGGYRLLCLHNGEHLIFVYAGTHDECHQWLETHRGSALDAEIYRESLTRITLTPEDEPLGCAEILPVTAEPDQYEEELLARLDDKTLGYIFRGFTGN